MLSKSQIKLIKSLSQKKFRNRHGLFVVEGLKGVGEFLNSDYELVSLFTAGEDFKLKSAKLNQVQESELKKISFLKTPQEVLAVFKIPVPEVFRAKGLCLALDGVRDPGNLGTIIRLCDWFGIEDLICSDDTVDCYNPKVIQATMGSLTRINIIYQDLPDFFRKYSDIPVFGTLLEGENIYTEKLTQPAIVVMGNEANGISREVSQLITKRLTIPQFGQTQETESLNVATASAIVLSEFKRTAFTER